MLNLSKSIKIPSKYCMSYKRFTFPGGEEHIKLDIPKKGQHIDKILLSSSMANSNDVMATFMATNAIKQLLPKAEIELLAPYFPYARQDRPMVKGEPLSIKVMADMINSQRYDRVHVLDPHSDVCPALIERVNILDNTPFVERAWINIAKYHNFDNSDMCIVSPDAGAEKKVVKIATNMQIENDNVIYGSKKRDVTNGKLTGFDFKGNVKDKNCIIVDDIIDGGGTFIGLADKLKEGGAKSIHLIGTHGIFSKGSNVLLNHGIDSLHVTDSFPFDSINDGKVNVVPIQSFTDFFSHTSKSLIL